MRLRLQSAALAVFAFATWSCADAPSTSPVAPEAGPALLIAESSPVRFSEIHYDNTGTDVGEAIELAGPAGFNLAGWKIVLYNGANGLVYSPTVTFGSVQINSACGANGVYVQTYASNGIQNGSPDGMALVDPDGRVVEFLSYEGTMTALDGPAAGLVSTDIGVFQNGSGAIGNSLKRSTRTTWLPESPNSFGECNFTDSDEQADVESVAVDPATVTILRGSSRTLTATARDADGNPVAATITWSSSDEAIASVDAAGVVTGIAEGAATITATADGKTGSAEVTVEEPATSPSGSIWISEIHYDNTGTDVGEAVEIEGPAGTSVAGWRIYLYNGNGGALYGPAPTLAGVIPSQCDGRGTVLTYIAGIQNGDPDGVALVDAAGVVRDFISYGGTFTAVGGPADGMIPRDIGVKQSSSTAVGLTLQRKGDTWYGPIASTLGECNGDAPPPPPERRVNIFGRGSGDPDLPVGFEYQLFASLIVGTATVPAEFTWRSTNPGIATIDARGVVRAIAPGSVRVEATADDGTVGSFTVRTETGTLSSTANYLNSTEFGIPTDGDASDDFLVTRPQFTSSYSYRRNTPNWVSWTLDASQFGSLDRCNCFTPEPALPSSFRRISTADYTGAGAVAGFGIDRGHLARSFDRTGGSLDNAATFLFSNIIPQAADNNQGPWAVLEDSLGRRARTGQEVVYNIAGVAGDAGTVKNEGIITIPSHVWKVAVIMPRGQGLAHVTSHRDIEVIAVVMPNVAGIRNVPWTTYQVTVDSVEALSGYDLLARLRNDIEVAVESGTVPPVAVAGGPYRGIVGAPISVSGLASHDADGDPLTYAWSFGDGASATGATATHTYTAAGTFTVRLIVTDSRGLADTVSTTAAIASQVAALQEATAVTSNLVSSGALGAGHGQALSAKLAAAVAALSSGGESALAAQATTAPAGAGARSGRAQYVALVQVRQAAAQLDTFIAAGHITAANAAPLKALLARLVVSLGG